MANELTNLTPQILAGILPVLRENSVMPRLINNSYSGDATARGKSIDINDVEDMEAGPITPGYVPTPGEISDVKAKQVSVTLDNFDGVMFPLTDVEIREIQNGTLPRAMEKAVKALVNRIDKQILGLYTRVPHFVGTAGTTPFASNSAAARAASRVLNSNLADMDDRSMVVDPFAYANAQGLDVLERVDASGRDETLRDGVITRAFGFRWEMDQNVLDHEVGMSGTYAVDAAAVAGASTVVLDNGAGAAPPPPAVGDLFSIAGSNQVYTVLTVAAATPSANEVTVTVYPGLDQDIADGDAVTIEVTADNTVNLAFHRAAFGFASRPLLDLETPGSLIQPIVDDISGLAMRMEIARYHKQSLFSLDCLYGLEAVRPDLAVRVLG